MTSFKENNSISYSLVFSLTVNDRTEAEQGPPEQAKSTPLSAVSHTANFQELGSSLPREDQVSCCFSSNSLNLSPVHLNVSRLQIFWHSLSTSKSNKSLNVEFPAYILKHPNHCLHSKKTLLIPFFLPAASQFLHSFKENSLHESFRLLSLILFSRPLLNPLQSGLHPTTLDKLTSTLPNPMFTSQFQSHWTFQQCLTAMAPLLLSTLCELFQFRVLIITLVCQHFTYIPSK